MRIKALREIQRQEQMEAEKQIVLILPLDGKNKAFLSLPLDGVTNHQYPPP
jgi:hypothetical protein